MTLSSGIQFHVLWWNYKYFNFVVGFACDIRWGVTFGSDVRYLKA